MPPPSTSRGGNNNNSYRPNASSSGGTKRQRGAAANNNRNPTPLVSDTHPAHDQISASHTNGSRRNSDSYNNNLLPSTAHPSLPPPYGNANGSGHNHVSSTYDVHGISHTHGIGDALDWGIPRTQQLEGPGMPVARSASLHSQAASVPAVHSAAAADPTDAGDGDGDGDDRTYCFCDRVSYGEMIACDDGQCEREWVCLVFC
jgi:inhibitor of growth protein 3